MGLTKRSTAALIVGVVIGAIATSGATLFLADSGADEPSAEQTTTTSVALASRLVVHDAWFGNVHFRPSDVTTEDESLNLPYDLVSFGVKPAVWYGSDVGAVPSKWELRTLGGGRFDATTTNRESSAISFELPTMQEVRRAVELVVTEWQLKALIPIDVTMKLMRGEQAEVYDGSTVVFAGIRAQDDDWIATFIVDEPPESRGNPEVIHEAPIALGIGPEWTNTSTTDNGFELRWRGEEPPQQARFTLRLLRWLPVAEAIGVGTAVELIDE